MNIIRDENGIMLMKVFPSLVNRMLDNFTGKVTIKKFKDGSSKKCFVFTCDQSLTNPYIGIIYFWKNSYIEL